MMWQSIHDAWWRLATTSQPRPPTPTPASLVTDLTDHCARSVLQGAAWLYGAGLRVRVTAYSRSWVRPHRLPCPVISVGNLVVGGTGKTACVEWLATKLLRRGARVSILSRGYGGRRPSPYTLQQVDGRLVVNGSSADDGQAIADEPRWLAQRLQGVPVLVGRRREQTGRHACQAFHATALILDDGLQYRRPHRGCGIIPANADMPLGGWPLFPRGPMREGLSALRRADIVIVTKADGALDTVAALQERLRTYNPQAVMACAVHEPVALRDELTGQPIGLDQLATARVHLLSSIGDPEGFERTVQQVGATVLSHRRFTDHARYRAADVRDFASRLPVSEASIVVTTEKDALRLAAFTSSLSRAGVRLWVLRVRMKLISGEPEIDDRLAAVLGR